MQTVALWYTNGGSAACKAVRKEHSMGMRVLGCDPLQVELDDTCTE